MKVQIEYSQEAIAKMLENAKPEMPASLGLTHFKAEKETYGGWKLVCYDEAGWAEKLQDDAETEKRLAEYRAEAAAKKEAEKAKAAVADPFK